MLFNSFVFLFAFLPLLLVLYYVTPKKYRNYTLLLFSLIFYAWGGVSYSLILISSILINYLFVKQIEKNIAHKKRWLIVGLILNILIIVLFKYLDFILYNINVLGYAFDTDFPLIPYQNIVLPLGISFFTFQQMSLLWDVYRNENTQKTSLANIALYISLFPQLIAGPIVRYNDIVDQIKSRVSTIQLFRSGVQRFILGLFKKVIIANTCGELADMIFMSPIDSLGTSTAWLGIIAYTFQIYFDFSGYSDMAIGLGRMFGFRILENFNFPYISKSIQEFWRRWHISLSTWFRDYVYIPLGGSRGTKTNQIRNVFIIFIVSGFWHGANWTFIVWGALNALYFLPLLLNNKNRVHTNVVAEDKVLPSVKELLQILITFSLTLFAWIFFRAENVEKAFLYIKRIFKFSIQITDRLSLERFAFELLPLIGLLILIEWFSRQKEHPLINTKYPTLFTVFIVLLIVLFGSFSNIQEFIYFQF